MAQPWMRWAAAEGLTKTGSSLITKTIGISAASFLGAVLSTLVIGSVQALGGCLGALAKGVPLKVRPVQLLLCVCFGTCATVSTWLMVFVFTFEDAEVGVFVFLASLSIVPGALFGWILFGERLSARQCLGIGVFVLAGYAMLNFPNLETVLHLPTWVLIASVIPFTNALNEVITQAQSRAKIAPLDPWVNNFWIGETTIVLSAVMLIFLEQLGPIENFAGKFWLSSVLTGLFVVAMIYCKLLSFQRGGTIAIKKLVMSGTFLSTTVVMGFLIYGEPVTFGKILGIVGFLVAFALTDNATWLSLRIRFGLIPNTAL